jgi:peptidoglycan hydrolase CwlO-like protein
LSDLKEKAEHSQLEKSEQFDSYKNQSEAKINELNGQLEVVFNERNELTAQFEEASRKLAYLNQTLTETEASLAEHTSLQARLSSLDVERDSLSKGKHF